MTLGLASRMSSIAVCCAAMQGNMQHTIGPASTCSRIHSITLTASPRLMCPVRTHRAHVSTNARTQGSHRYRHACTVTVHVHANATLCYAKLSVVGFVRHL